MQLPNEVIISDVNITHNIPNFKTQSMSLIEKVKSRGIHILEGDVNVTVGESVRAQKKYTSFVIKVQGSYNTFELDLPMHFKSEHMSENPTTLNAIDVGANKITLGVFDGEVYEGSCFTLPNDTKIYFAKNDAVAGEELEFYPAARQSVLSGGEINFISPVITVRFKDDAQSYSYSENGYILEATLDWIEAL